MKIILPVGLLISAVALYAQTNVAAPATWGDNTLNQFQNILTGLLVILSAVLGVVTKLKSDKASTVDVLIRAIADFDNRVLERSIKAKAIKAGVEETLHKAVKKVKGKKA